VTKRSIEQKAPARKPAGRKPTRATKVTARKVAGFAYDKKAVDLLIMDLRKVTDVTSFFIVCSGESGPQVKAIADNVLEHARKAGIEIYNVEGYEALRWILMFPAVTCAIPGGKRVDQVTENVEAADFPALSDESMSAIDAIYDQKIKPLVHHYW